MTRSEALTLERVAAHGYLNRFATAGQLRFTVSSHPGHDGPGSFLVPASAACALIEKGLVAFVGMDERHCTWYQAEPEYAGIPVRSTSIGPFRSRVASV